MNAAHMEKRGIAEQAALWIEEIDSAEGQGGHSAAFLKWLKASPVHVHEFLLAARVRDALGQVDRQRHIDVDALIAAASVGSNVRHIDTRPSSIPYPGMTRRRWLT